MPQKYGTKRTKISSGSITVYLALSFVLIAALILTIVESARTISERLYVQVALDASMENLFSQYHRPLWENYRLLGLQYRTDSDLKKELCEFIKPYQNAHNLFSDAGHEGSGFLFGACPPDGS